VWEGGRYGLFDRLGNLLPAIDAFAAVNPPPGDFNGDHIVDDRDLAVWSAAFGPVGGEQAADADQDGDVDGADFLVWQHRLTGATGGQPLPEPISYVHVCLCTLAWANSRRRGLRRRSV
jgi:hypothetical protein